MEQGVVINRYRSRLRRSRVLVPTIPRASVRFFRRLLIADGHECDQRRRRPSALDAVRRHQPDVILLGVAMPAMAGSRSAAVKPTRPPV